MLLWLASAGCNDDRRYVGEDGVYQVALTEDTPPAFATDEAAVYIVEQRIELPIRRPSQTELDDLQKGASRYENLPFPRLPWIGRDDLALQIDFTLSNLDKQERQVTVTVNGIDEFYEYEPGVTIVDDDAVPDYAQWEKLYSVKGQTRLVHTVREEDLDEVAVDLATVVNGAPNSNQVVYIENKSYDDPRNKKYIPQVVPGLAGVRVGLRATDPGRWLLEASVRVRDSGDRLAAEGAMQTFQIMPQPFMPVVVDEDEP
jgi:hypothetical protein